MKIYCYTRDLLRVTTVGNVVVSSSPFTVIGFLFQLTSNKCLTYEEGEWERFRSALSFQFHMLGVHRIRDSSILEFLITTGQGRHSIPLTRWERVIEWCKKKWRRLSYAG